MINTKWQAADLRPEPGYHLFPGMEEAQSYRGPVIYPAYDFDFGGCVADEWTVEAETTGHVVLNIRATEEEAYDLATKLAEMLDWAAISEPAWHKVTRDPAFLSFMASHYEQVSIPLPDNGLDDIVPYRN